MAAMRLTPWEEERLLIFTAAELARRHRSAGLLLNAPEAVALICDAMLEAARAGADYAGPAASVESVPQSSAGLRVQTTGDSIVTGWPGSAYRPGYRDRQ